MSQIGIEPPASDLSTARLPKLPSREVSIDAAPLVETARSSQPLLCTTALPRTVEPDQATRAPTTRAARLRDATIAILSDRDDGRRRHVLTPPRMGRLRRCQS